MAMVMVEEEMVITIGIVMVTNHIAITVPEINAMLIQESKINP